MKLILRVTTLLLLRLFVDVLDLWRIRMECRQLIMRATIVSFGRYCITMLAYSHVGFFFFFSLLLLLLLFFLFFYLVC
jgi:hypothetical protein